MTINGDGGNEKLTVDEAAALAALDGHRQLLQELAVMFFEDAPQLLDQLEAAVAAADAVESRRLVHSLKGLVATFYAQPTCEIAQSMESEAAAGRLEPLADGGCARLRASVDALFLELKSLGLVQQG